jgi:hypothetical protein
MEWDLGVKGVALLLGMAAGFGLLVQLILWRVSTHWLWLVGAVAYVASGLFVSEVWFGWATQEDLQPNINGLSFDEVLLLAPLIAVGIMLVIWLIRRIMLPPIRGMHFRRSA